MYLCLTMRRAQIWQTELAPPKKGKEGKMGAIADRIVGMDVGT